MELELKNPYLLDENEREHAADHYLSELGNGNILELKLVVGPYKNKALNESISSYVKSKLEVAEIDIIEKGFFKKTTFIFSLGENKITHEYMLGISNVIYDLILAFDVTVELKKV